VQEESNLDILDRLIALTLVVDLFPQQSGQQHEVVILDPDQIAIANNLRDSLCKERVGLLIRTPVLFVERDLTGMVVEKWPEDAKDSCTRK